MSQYHHCCFYISLIPLTEHLTRDKYTTFIVAITSHIDENYVSVANYAAGSGNSLLTFRDNLSVPSSRVKNPDSSPLKTRKVDKELPLLAAY